MSKEKAPKFIDSVPNEFKIPVESSGSSGTEGEAGAVIEKTPWSDESEAVKTIGAAAVEGPMEKMYGGYTGDAPSNNTRLEGAAPGRYIPRGQTGDSDPLAKRSE